MVRMERWSFRAIYGLLNPRAIRPATWRSRGESLSTVLISNHTRSSSQSRSASRPRSRSRRGKLRASPPTFPSPAGRAWQAPQRGSLRPHLPALALVEQTFCAWVKHWDTHPPSLNQMPQCPLMPQPHRPSPPRRRARIMRTISAAASDFRARRNSR